MEGDLRERTQDLVKMILETAGYEIECADEPFDLSGVGEDDGIVVLISDNPAEIDRFNRRTFRLKREDGVQECRKVLVTFSGSDAPDCTVWGEEEIAGYAGKAAVAGIFGRRIRLGGGPEAQPARAPPGLEVESEISILHLPVRISEKNASIIAGTRGPVRCRFVPYWCCHCTSTGSRTVANHRVSFEADRWGGLNAINGTTMDMKVSDAVDTGMSENCEVLAPKIRREDAEEQAVAATIDSLTQRVRIKHEEGDTISYQEETIKPDRKDITAETMLIYVPVWEIEGRDRIVEVNAYTGEILAMPMDEGVEVF
ncbi:MAG: hypothetical protein PWP08_395 [Methanofollis sp.]|nr:hypothetical protein [Methanofollis sp.]